MKFNRDTKTFKKPFTIILFDATDAYYYADIMGKMSEVDTLDDLELAKKVADSLFIFQNYKWESLSQMNEADGGYDVRIFDANHSCVYAAHEKYQENWIV